MHRIGQLNEMSTLLKKKHNITKHIQEEIRITLQQVRNWNNNLKFFSQRKYQPQVALSVNFIKYLGKK